MTPERPIESPSWRRQTETTAPWRRPVELTLWRRSSLVLAGLVLCALAIETSVTFRMMLFGVEPSLLLGLVYYFARYQGAIPGAVLGFLVGLLEDLSTPEHLGLHALAKCLVGYAIGKLWTGQRMFKDNLRAQTVTLLAAAVAHDALVLAVVAHGHPGRFLSLFFRLGLPSAIYTAIFCPLFVTIWSWLRVKGPQIHARLFRFN
jgi:rod shape-determining protein MreD